MADVYSLSLRADTRDIDRGKESLDKFGRSADTTGRKSKDLEGGTGKLTQSFGGLRVAAVAAIAALGGFSVGRIIRDTANFGESVARLGVVSGATSEQMAALEAQARSLGATTLFTAQQTAEAQTFLAQAGFEANEILSATPGILQLATAASLDLAQAADLASNVLSGFGLEAQELGRVNDVLAATAASSNTNVEQLGQSLSFAAPLARSAGISIEETAAAIGALGDAGLQGSRAGTGLLGVIRQLSNVTPQAETALSSYGLTLADIDVTTRGLQPVLETLGQAGISVADSFTIFGSEANTAAQILAGASGRVGDLTGELQNADGTAAEAAETMGSTLAGAIAGLNSAFSESVLQAGESAGAMQALISTATGVISVYNDMLPQFVEANDLTEQQARNIELIAAGLSTVGQTALVIGGVTVALRSAAVAQVAFNVAARANPWVLGTTAILAAVSAINNFRQANTDAAVEARELSRELNELTSGMSSLTEAELRNRESNLASRLSDAQMEAQEYADELDRVNAIGEQNASMANRVAAEVQRLERQHAAATGRVGQLSEAHEQAVTALELLESQLNNTTTSGHAAADAIQRIIDGAEEEAAALGETNRQTALRQALHAGATTEQLKAIDAAYRQAEAYNAEAAAARAAASAEEQRRQQFEAVQDRADPEKAEFGRYMEELAIIEEFSADAAEEEALREDAFARHIQNMANIADQGADRQAGAARDIEATWQNHFTQLGGIFSQAEGVFGQITSIARKAHGEQSDEYREALIMQRAFAAASIAINTAMAAAAALAPPPIGLGPVAGLPYAVAIGSLGAASIAATAAQTGMELGRIDGARADGGPVQAGGRYLVGERGPEIVQMGNQGGNVIPNHELGGGGDTSVTNVTNVFQISAGVEGTVRREIEQAVPMITEMSKRAVESAINAGGSMSRATGRRR